MVRPAQPRVDARADAGDDRPPTFVLSRPRAAWSGDELRYGEPVVRARSAWWLGVLAAVSGGALSLTPGCSSDTPTLNLDPAEEDATAPDAGDGGRDAAEAPPEPGFLAEYFDQYTVKVVTRVEKSIDHVWGREAADPAVGTDHFSIRWRGTLKVPETGTYTFVTEGDDGVRLYVDDELVLDDWRGHLVERKEVKVDLQGGTEVAFRLDYFEYDLDAQIRVLWSSPTRPEALLTSEHVTAAKEPTVHGPIPPYVNPIVPRDCPDPGVLAVPADDGPAYYALCTGGSFPLRSSRNLIHWSDTGVRVLPNGKPSWAANGSRNWAPELHRVGDTFVAHYTTVNASNALVIAASVAPNILGPYTEGRGPIFEHPHGVIDSNYFEDADGSRWLLFKNDGNGQSPQQPTLISIRRLAADGVTFAPGSSATELIRNNRNTWEGGVVEAPWLIKRGNYYYLFYSGNVYNTSYRTGVARATNLLGPYQKMGPPILGNNARWEGPGHGSVVRVRDVDYFVYHAWPRGDSTQRQMLLDRIDWENDWPKIHDGTPSRTAQPSPGDLR